MKTRSSSSPCPDKTNMPDVAALENQTALTTANAVNRALTDLDLVDRVQTKIKEYFVSSVQVLHICDDVTSIAASFTLKLPGISGE